MNYSPNNFYDQQPEENNQYRGEYEESQSNKSQFFKFRM